MIPRYYQNEAVYSVWDYFNSGGKGNPIIAMPTGTGKSLVIASLIKSIYHYFPNQKVISITHVKELIEQNFDKLIKIWPTAPSGIYSAGLNRKDTDCSVTFAGIASIKNIAEHIGHVDIVIVDECHLIPPKENTMYGKFFTMLRKANPKLKVIGLTATPFRLGQGMLTEQPSLFTDICCDMTTIEYFNRFIREGYLVPLVPKPTGVTIDTSSVGMRGQEFIDKDLQQAADREEITYGALKETLELASDRKHWLIFATGLTHAGHIQAMLEDFGVTCGLVHSKMSTADRDKQIKLFKNGTNRAMVNVGILTTGFDFPAIDLIVMLRPTCSPVLWVQMLGRGTRPDYADGFDLTKLDERLAAIAASEKQNCMVLDFAGNTPRLGPINDPLIPKKKGSKGGGSAPVKTCPSCNTYVHASLRECEHCGHIFPPAVNFSSVAGSAELIAKEKAPPQIDDYEVSKVTYSIHRKAGRPDSLKVSYHCGLRIFNEWVCPLHEGFAKRKAATWWRLSHLNGSDAALPTTIEEALDQVDFLKAPISISVRTDVKYPEILKLNYF